MRREDKEYLDAIGTGIRAEFKACTDLLGYKLDEVIFHQKETNGRLTKQESRTRFACWIQEHPKLSIVFFIFSIAVIILLTDIFGIRAIVQTIIK